MTESRLSLLVWHWGRTGGGPRYMLDMAKALMDRHDVDVSLSYSLQSEQATNLESLNLPSLAISTFDSLRSAAVRSSRLPAIRRRFEAFLDQQSVVVVYTPMAHVWDRSMLSTISRSGAKRIVTVHEGERELGRTHSLVKRITAAEIRDADGVITLTDHIRRQVAKQYAPKGPIRVIPHPAFRFEGQPGGDADDVGRFRILFLGRIVDYKGLDLLIEAYRLLTEQRGPCVTLTIAGAGDLRGYQASIDALPNVRVVNRWLSESEIGDLLAHADAVAVPYLHASQSGIVASAFGAGVPVVVTPVGGLTEQVRSGDTGLVSRSLSPADFAVEIGRLMDDPSLRKHIVKHISDEVAGDLSWDVAAAGVTAFARDLTEEG